MPEYDIVGRAVLAGALLWYGHNVLQPARTLMRSGLVPPRPASGDPPLGVPAPGLGARFSRHSTPVLLDKPVGNQNLVAEFDRMAAVYEPYVRPFSDPIFDEALERMRAYLAPDSRVLDVGCGPGRELQRVARLVPNGEVVGVDLAAGMVHGAYRSARAHGIDNCAFFQADVCDLPASFDGQFDVVYSSLAHHHYPDPRAATASILRCLRPGGVYCVVDPGPAWYNALTAPIAQWGDPGWIGFHSPDEFRALYLSAGFARAAWFDLLPGFGLAVGQRAGMEQ